MPNLELRGAHIHYLDVGHGPDVVILLHAFPLHAGMWTEQAHALSTGHRVLAIDASGFGESTARAAGSTIADQAADVLALCDHLRIPSAAVVGLSMGGYAAFELLAARPEFVRALVLCDTRATADTPEAAAKRETFAGEALERGVGWVADQLLPKLLGPHAEPRLQNLVRGMIGQATPAAVADAQFAMAARRDATELLPSITCPTLVVVGSEDALTPPSDARAMAAAIPHARLVELHGAGHLSNLEARVGFNRAMRDFLDHLPKHAPKHGHGHGHDHGTAPVPA
jgi:pimeloyl-ACP methyl ester carboxylesterase